jgi:hypothetical protein
MPESSMRPARFKIKRTAPASWALRDRARPAFLHTATSHDGALRAMDNVIRREKGLAPRIVWPTDNGPHDGQSVIPAPLGVHPLAGDA